MSNKPDYGNIEATELLYEGKAKKVYETNDKDLLIQEFKDDATAFDAKKRGTIRDKGVINNKISARLFELLETKGVGTHFVSVLNDNSMLIKRLEIFKIEVTIRNIVAGGMARLFNLAEGMRLKLPVFELHYKSDELSDPLMNETHALALDLITSEELRIVKERSYEVNNVLMHFFADRGLELVDFKLEFGRFKGKVLLGDEISPDTCRLWEKGTNKKLDKDRFRFDLGDVEEAYNDVLGRVLR